MIRPAILALGFVLPALLAEAPAADPVKPGASATDKAKSTKAVPKHQLTTGEMLSDAGETIEEESHGRSAKDSEGHVEPNILAIQPSLMVTTIIVFSVLLFVLYRLAWGPLTKALDDRERFQQETLEKAEHSRAESERLLKEHRLQMESAAEQVRQLLEDARKQAESNANTIVEKARAEAEAEGVRAKREISAARDQALVEIWTKAADTAVSVAGKVLAKEMNPEDHRRLVEAATKALPSLSMSANGHGGHSA